MNPSISVIVFSYNFEEYLEECIESILSQTLMPFEIIICDDCSQDQSPSIIQKYTSRYPSLIKSYIHSKNIGPAKNGNFAKQAAAGDLVSWMDGDDRWLPEKLEFEWRALRDNPEAKIAYSNVYRIDHDGNRIQKWYNGLGAAPPVDDVFIETYSKNFFPNKTSLFRNFLFYRSCYEKIDYNDISLGSFWDWDEKIRLTSEYLVVYSGKALVEYRDNPKSIGKNNSQILFRAFKDVYEKHLKLLAKRDLEDKARVQVRLESIIALRQYNLLGQNINNEYSLNKVFQRNIKLLKKLKKNIRHSILENNRDILKVFMKHLIEDNISTNHIYRAYRYQVEFSNCKFNLPKSISIALIKMAKSFIKKRKKRHINV